MPLADWPDGQATVTLKVALAVITDSTIASRQVVMSFTFIYVLRLFLPNILNSHKATSASACRLEVSFWIRLICHVNTNLVKKNTVRTITDRVITDIYPQVYG